MLVSSLLLRWLQVDCQLAEADRLELLALIDSFAKGEDGTWTRVRRRTTG